MVTIELLTASLHQEKELTAHALPLVLWRSNMIGGSCST